MGQPNNNKIAAIYDERSAQYDQSFHPRQAEDFVKWAELKEGQQVLDLCCGTGLVSLLAKTVVGPSGKVIGVDVSEQMMNEGRHKAAAAGLEVEFIYGDVTNLAREDLLAPDARGFDLITCASALVLLDDPHQALKLWASFLAPGGKLILDAPVEEAMLGGRVMEQVLKDVGLPSELLYSRDWITSVDSLEQAVRGAGLAPLRVFETPDYLTSQFDTSEAPEHFDKLVRYTKVGDDIDPELKKRAKDEFVVRIKECANVSNKIQQDVRFYVAIATRVN